MVGLGVKVRRLFGSAGVNSVLLRNSCSGQDPNFTYFSGLPHGVAQGNFLILRRGKKPLLLATELDAKHCKSAKGISVKVLKSRLAVKKAVRRELRGGKIGLDYGAITKRDFSGIKKISKGKMLVDVSGKIARLREIKSPEEIRCIRKAVRITESTLGSVPRIFRRGMTERQLALRIEMRFRELADNSVPFDIIVASGKNASSPHHVPGSKKIGNGFLMVDAGCSFKNYGADLTRTFFVGKAGGKEKKLYLAVFEAKQLAISMAKPGAKCGEVFSNVDRFIKKKTGKALPHGLGHGLGIEVHDQPKGFTLSSSDVLREGMVLTVEPAFYGKYGGVRIEDDIAVTAKGCGQLSSAPPNLVELP